MDKYVDTYKIQATGNFTIGLYDHDDFDKTSDRGLLTKDGIEVGMIKGSEWLGFLQTLKNLQDEINFTAGKINIPKEERDAMVSDLRKKYYDTLYQPVVEAVAKSPALAQHLPDEMFVNDKNLENKIVEARKEVLIQEQKTHGAKLYSRLMKLEDPENE